LPSARYGIWSHFHRPCGHLLLDRPYPKVSADMSMGDFTPSLGLSLPLPGVFRFSQSALKAPQLHIAVIRNVVHGLVELRISGPTGGGIACSLANIFLRAYRLRGGSREPFRGQRRARRQTARLQPCGSEGNTGPAMPRSAPSHANARWQPLRRQTRRGRSTCRCCAPYRRAPGR
jgi:hypothetical protein